MQRFLAPDSEAKLHSFGNARISVVDRSLAAQVGNLPRVSCARILLEKVLGTRPSWNYASE